MPLLLAAGIWALNPGLSLTPASSRQLALQRGWRCSRVRCDFSPAYDTTIRYAAADWARNLRTLPGSLILRRIRSPLVSNVVVTLIICALQHYVGLPALVPLPHTLLGSALGLLLVFRTNAAYDRFWEARKQWGLVTTECRNLAGLACTFMSPQQALPMLTLTAAFPVVVKNYLRGGSKSSQERDARRLRALLAPQEVDALKSVINQPQYVIARLRMLGQASAAPQPGQRRGLASPRARRPHARAPGGSGGRGRSYVAQRAARTARKRATASRARLVSPRRDEPSASAPPPPQ